MMHLSFVLVFDKSLETTGIIMRIVTEEYRKNARPLREFQELSIEEAEIRLSSMSLIC